MHRLPHSPYFRDRDSEYDLCQDFPGDEILIDGLHAMQSHFYNNGVNVTIPVVRLMNTVHYLASYMFSTECSGDQMEYDVLAYDSYGRDKQFCSRLSDEFGWTVDDHHLGVNIGRNK